MSSKMTIDGVTFTYGGAIGRSGGADQFYLGKPNDLVSDYLDLLDQVEDLDMLELGILQGGSAALAALVGRPRKLVAIDVCEPVAALDQFIEGRGMGDRLRPKYGVDQANQDELRRIVSAEFGGGLDLVIDDASHLLDPTRASFEALFPLLRPGGRYLIEDWHWEVRFAAEFARLAQEEPAAARRMIGSLRLPDSPLHAFAAALLSRTDDVATVAVLDGWDPPQLEYEPLVGIVGELAAAHAGRPDVVASVHVEDWWVAVQRGPAEVGSPCSLAGLAGLCAPLV